MRAFRLLIGAVAVCALSAAVPASAQNVLQLPGGKTVEVIGLEDWTIAMLQDSLARHGDGVTLESHACAAVLRERLGFADAAVQSFLLVMDDDTTEYVAVSVVEPADSARVRRRAVGRDTTGFPAGWEDIGGLMRRNGGVGFALVNRMRRVPPGLDIDSAALRHAWAWVDGQQTPEGRAAAVRAVQSHPNLHARILAATLLRDAPADATVMHALVRALRDDVDMVASMAGQALPRMAAARQGFDWSPVADDVHALLDGSSLYALDPLLQSLAGSGADARWASPFLAGGGHAVLARLSAENPRMRSGAHRLLVALRGEDLGRDPAAWRAWVASLSPAAGHGR